MRRRKSRRRRRCHGSRRSRRASATRPSIGTCPIMSPSQVTHSTLILVKPNCASSPPAAPRRSKPSNKPPRPFPLSLPSMPAFSTKRVARWASQSAKGGSSQPAGARAGGTRGQWHGREDRPRCGHPGSLSGSAHRPGPTQTRRRETGPGTQAAGGGTHRGLHRRKSRCHRRRDASRDHGLRTLSRRATREGRARMLRMP